MTFELTDEGLTIQTVDEIIAELQTALRDPTTGVHPQLDLSTTSPLGRLVGILAEREHEIQLGVRDVHSAFSPKATGQALDNVCALTGTTRAAAGRSLVTASCTLTAGTTLPAGSRANVNGDTTALFESIDNATNSSGITAVVAVPMRAVNTGPVRAAAGSLTVINTPVSGWSAVTNAFDADVGAERETDPALRLKREEELRAQGSANLLAVEADVRNVEGVLEVQGFENTADVTDVDGVTPHAIEIVVWDGVAPAASDDNLAQAIFDSACGGIASVRSGLGTAGSGSAVDVEGGTHTVLFTRALQKTLYITYQLAVNSDYPVDGDAQVQSAAAEAVTAMWGVGDDVLISKLYAPALSVPGVTDVVSIKAGFSASPSGSVNLAVGSREIAVPDTSRIVVTT